MHGLPRREAAQVLGRRRARAHSSRTPKDKPSMSRARKAKPSVSKSFTCGAVGCGGRMLKTSVAGCITHVLRNMHAKEACEALGAALDAGEQYAQWPFTSGGVTLYCNCLLYTSPSPRD